MENDKKYTLTCTGEQMMVICSAVEDWHRFLAGQCEMANATAMCEKMHDVQDILNNEVRPFIVPALKYNRGAAYGWSGSGCPNDYQRKMIAMSYGIYRQILHFNALQNPNGYNVYQSETLTCEEQGGLIEIKEAKDE